ncbi:MAG: ribonuclease III [Lachnospiraceae bacterium]|jgi:ribonuclease-3|uniref:ribonuclease III n=1 Tax=Candidatus Merdisoma sp. JLR.KK011 TaxID=3114299 RepID=UPI00143492CD|nr:ribonuclease III [Lachnospiraceae bacterium]MCI9479102.1 ribonuclease III [Lachnospiraceae bacterium]MCI9623184.1 ribonuclease III [Lachnospiraceae bacterium]GFI11872.1 ribonuclease 3 [Lachnospiraceae bacterium]
MKFEQLEERIGYRFKEPKLLKQAMCHSSFANERHMDRLLNNERLEFLGDAVLELITSEFLFKNYPKMPEGEATRTRASIVCEQTLALCARELGLGAFLLLGKGEDLTGGRDRDSITSDALEALLGAVYLDGGFASAKEFVHRFVLNDIEHKKLFFDSKTILQEEIQGETTELLHYVLTGEEGPDHNKRFMVHACLGSQVIGEGSGRTKKAAEQEAAYRALIERHRARKD